MLNFRSVINICTSIKYVSVCYLQVLAGLVQHVTLSRCHEGCVIVTTASRHAASLAHQTHVSSWHRSHSMLLSLNIIYPLSQFKYISASHYFHASYHIYAEEFDVVTKVSLLWRRTVCAWRRGLLTTEGSDHVQRCTVLQDVYSTVQCTVQLRNVTGDDPLHTVSTPSLHHAHASTANLREVWRCKIGTLTQRS